MLRILIKNDYVVTNKDDDPIAKLEMENLYLKETITNQNRIKILNFYVMNY